MAIPLLIGGAAVLTGILGVGAGLSAKEKWDKAERKVNNAKSNYEHAQKELNDLADKVQKSFVDLGQLKVDIFQTQIAHIVNVMSQVHDKSTSSKLTNFEQSLTMQDIKELKHQLKELDELELASSIGGALTTGALAGFGVYGASILATASTGTAIASLSGAAATNATLAWLGGGSLAAGGLGMAGGTALLGGVVTAPALLIAGAFMDSKAEEALSEAEEYVGKVKIEIANIEKIKSLLNALNANVQESTNVLNELVERFERVKVYDNKDPKKYNQMLMVGKAMKEVLNTPIMNKEGEAQKGIDVTYSGILETVSNI